MIKVKIARTQNMVNSFILMGYYVKNRRSNRNSSMPKNPLLYRKGFVYLLCLDVIRFEEVRIKMGDYNQENQD